ncbi:MAG: M20/M25/M40 family metallo-hydrolase [Candidatus Riflebacteria bacterium]|nr:M20/M25/M40 family metallo-hydrolase [Candidatus Riflebacteria bacterium]
MDKDTEFVKLVEKVKALGSDAYEDCVAFLSHLIACRSLSGHEGECAQRLVEFFKASQIPCYVDSRGSILAIYLPNTVDAPLADAPAGSVRQWLAGEMSLARAAGRKVLAYNAHLDVVSADTPEEWQSEPFVATRRDGRIYGRGCCDMKGALATMAMAMVLNRGLADASASQAIVLGCFCTEEEAGEGLAFRDLCEEFGLQPDYVILGEPSKMQIARGQRGKLECLIETSGVCAHTSVPETGDSAAYKLARAVLAVEAFDEAQRSRYGTDVENVLQRTTAAVTSIRSWPESKSFVPDRALAHVTARLALGENLASLSSKLCSDLNWPDAKIIPVVYRGRSYKGKESDWNSEHPAWETAADSPFFCALETAATHVLGAKPPHKIWPFSTDGVYSAGMAGIPTLGIGPGHEEMAHKIDEWVSEKELLQALQLYTLLPAVLPA